MVESVRKSEFRARLDEYEDMALTETVILTDEEERPRLALFSYEVFLQVSRNSREATNISGPSGADPRTALNAVSSAERHIGKRVKESEFRANLEEYEDMALSETVVITDEEAVPQLVLISHDFFEQLSRANLRAYHISELPKEALQSILNAKIPDDDEYESGWPDEDSA